MTLSHLNTLLIILPAAQYNKLYFDRKNIKLNRRETNTQMAYFIVLNLFFLWIVILPTVGW